MRKMERDAAALERERVASTLRVRAWVGLASHLSGKRFAAPSLFVCIVSRGF